MLSCISSDASSVRKELDHDYPVVAFEWAEESLTSEKRLNRERAVICTVS
jgi:hypothetical protein